MSEVLSTQRVVEEHLETAVHAVRQDATAVAAVEPANSLHLVDFAGRVQRRFVVRVVHHPVT